MEHLFFYWGAFCLGCVHAMDADHLCTVSSVIFNKKPFRELMNLAYKWALGHSFTLFGLATLMYAMKSGIELFQFSWGERIVGIAMIALSSWILFYEFKRKPHAEHTPSGNALFGIGVLHGAAGTAAILIMVPVALAGSFGSVMGYVLFFSAGMVLAMTSYSFLIYKLVWLKNLSVHLSPVRRLTALLTLGVGIKLAGA
jgi:Kef-type K+ transport system membrane component KefB